ncbi:hypothetical protein [Brachyspira hyodysenteriae]|uniref:hypothetical protein n=1 Tax=Brachyspira hyodysenteriae TaxID=159 RepID=UPI00063DC9A4|nr:hypothetical protein [Brachyspira hyodysenteriae]KLI13514.1 hypothetical protein SU45_13440 [Brachyspira hyodysenteriae]KLI59444.1 hypothetical protein SZ46_08820 [Brachyspira hyodysenteriae]
MSYSKTIREEELKNKVARDYFHSFDNTQIIEEIDFSIAPKKEADKKETEYFLWAEAKKGNKNDIYESFVQLILTIGKKRVFDKHLPPPFLGAFDAEKIAFIQYYKVLDVFNQNDFNWNVTPSDHESKEFKQLYNLVEDTLKNESYIYKFDDDDTELKEFIRVNFIAGKNSLSKVQIDKNNFVNIYSKWLNAVKTSISVDWDKAKTYGIIDADFYLADLLSENNLTLKEKLYVILKEDHYELDRKIDDMGLASSKEAHFYDKQKAHNEFWKRYQRPPKEEYWDYIIERRDLLVPQDIRERKGSYFTPRIWVEKSQEYIAEALGENWQDEYYIWDCAAGTGNLLAGLTNKYNIWASTLDKADVEIMKERVKNGANLLENHIFQFDFLNDEFDKLPKDLKAIIDDEEKRKKLVIYINPPYAEAGSGTGKNKPKVATDNKTYFIYKTVNIEDARIKLGTSLKELFVQFIIKIYLEIPNCIIAQFSTLKTIQAGNFEELRNIFLAKLEKMFIVPANTFDNVKGDFPIGFFIWNTSKKVKNKYIISNIFDSNGEIIKTKNIYFFNQEIKRINDWINNYKLYNKKDSKYKKIGKSEIDENYIGIIMADAPDFQNNKYISIMNEKTNRHGIFVYINEKNLIPICVYLSVRLCIEADWLNDRDQFLYPNSTWEEDTEFKNDCVAFTLFHSQNKISSEQGVNHWIPFTEAEVDAKDSFSSHFMTDFLSGKIKSSNSSGDLFTSSTKSSKPLKFSKEDKAVFKAGLALWKYYHSFDLINVNASYYDIRAFFQKFNDKGRMNPTSKDETYNSLLSDLKSKMDILAKKIAVKVYEHGFLKE